MQHIPLWYDQTWAFWVLILSLLSDDTLKFVGIDFHILASSIICSTAFAHKLLTCVQFRNCSIYLSPQPDIHSHMKVQGSSLAQPLQSQQCRPEWRPKRDPYSIHPASFWTGSWKFIPAQDRGQITPKKKNPPPK